MSNTASDVVESRSLITGVPAGSISYVLLLAALISAALHLWLVPVVMEFDQTQAMLFIVASLGLIAGSIVYVTRYWRRDFYLVAALYGLALLIAYFVLGGPTNPTAIVSKAAETILVIGAGYLYWASE